MFQLFHAAEHSDANAVAGNVAEPPFDDVPQRKGLEHVPVD